MEMTWYYLSRFKDSTRQGTIDLMLGNCVNEDIFSESKVQHEEEDNAATAEHVKLLIEDCKKMLINNPELVVGSWGLINADPSTGDPSETEMDSILILTKDSYYVADYDDQVDKITKYQRVILEDITLLECGMPDTISLFKSSKSHYCIRINYKIDGVGGYFHMFRSTQLRFFNNMAVAIKNDEEGIESLKSICEAFQVIRDITGLGSIPYHQGQKLDKRRSKVVTTGSTNSIYLDVVGLPNLTRNVSESQLLALKSAGSKAFSNVQQKFSKLNKLSSQFVSNKKHQPKFTVGKGDSKNDSSTDSEEDYETSIFQTDIRVETDSMPYSTDNSCDKNDNFFEEGVELIENFDFQQPLPPSSTEDSYLPGVGIVMGSTGEPENVLVTGQSEVGNSSNVDNVRMSSIMETSSLKAYPEICVNEEESKQVCPPTSLLLSRKLSRSSSDLDSSKKDANADPNSIYIATGISHLDKRSSSQQDISLNISQSQSESALKYKLADLASPVASVTKDLVLNPFSKFAKGVQNLGSNLDPRKFSVGNVKNITEQELEEHRQMQQKWRKCNTRLIAL